MSTGTLYIVATPIGNLEDITLRAVRILHEVDLVAAEDTRHSRKLLSHLGISKPLTSYFDHNKNIKGAVVLGRLLQGDSVALVTDAGTPCISDPGFQLVREAREQGIPVVPVPGPSSVTAALSAAGVPADSYVFEGFLPSRQGKRLQKIRSFVGEARTIIFFESPRRLLETLRDLQEVAGEREVVIARELTKIYEEFVRGKLNDVVGLLGGDQIKGEVVVILPPSPPEAPAPAEGEELLRRYLFEEKHSLKDAVRKVVEETKLPRREIYARALSLIEEEDN